MRPANGARRRYSAGVSDPDGPPVTDEPSYEPAAVGGAQLSRSGGAGRGRGGAIGWLIVTVVVLVLAVAGGLLTAWVVANMRAVPGPVAGASPTAVVRASAGASLPADPSPEQSSGPRHTPTPGPTVLVTPEPFVHVVGRGESIIYIAELYHVFVDDIITLNNLRNPNRLQVGQELLIPGYGVQPTTEPEE